MDFGMLFGGWCFVDRCRGYVWLGSCHLS
jgi:hypothetical protein